MADQDGAPKPPVPTKEDLPQELQVRSQFVAWRYEERDGELTKVPYRTNGNRADTTDPQTWTTLDKATRYVNANAPRFGIGYVFSEKDPYCGVDLDDCIDEEGRIMPWARQIIDELGSYAEVSPSRTGVKVIVKVTLPLKTDGKTGRRIQLPIGDDETREVELYDRERFFTLTGRHVDGVKAVAPAQAVIEGILARVAAPTVGEEITVKPTGLTDEEVLAWVTVHDRNAGKFRKLLNGDYSEYGANKSRGDFAAASKIGFYSGDPDQVERIMRSSAMYRDKWDVHTTYLRERTIQRAMAGLTETFTPTQAPDPTPEEKAERERQEKQRKAQEAWPKCEKLVHDSDILARVYETQKADGQVGEETNAKLMTLVGATRHTGRPMSVMVEGSSSAGKSDIIKRQIKCLPPHFVRELQSMSERALAYMGKDALRDTFLAVFELGGLGSDGKESLEMTKQLLTEGCIKRQIAESTPKGVRGRLIEVEGPTALWTTTTKTIIDHELSTRAFKVTADDSPATTRGVLVSIFEEERPPAEPSRPGRRRVPRDLTLPLRGA